MAITYSDYTGDGSNTDFAFSFPYLEDTHVVVEVDGIDKTITAGDFTLPTTSLVRMTVAPALAALVRVKRVSDFATDLVDFTNGSVLTEGDLDRAYQHNRYLNEEAAEGNDASMQIVGGGTDYNAANKKIVNLATPTASLDATNKNYVDDRIALSTSNLNAFDKSTHTGDNTETEFTLSFTSQSDTDEAYLVTIDGVVQTPTTAYGVNSTTNKITFTSAPPTSAAIVVVPIGTTATTDDAEVTATGSTTPRSLAVRFSESVNVKDFGAKGDYNTSTGTGTDDTAAILAAAQAATTGLVFEGDFYLSSAPTSNSYIPITDKNNFKVDASRARFYIGYDLVTNTTTAALFDIIGSKNVVIDAVNCYVKSSVANTYNYGILVVRVKDNGTIGSSNVHISSIDCTDVKEAVNVSTTDQPDYQTNGFTSAKRSSNIYIGNAKMVNTALATGGYGISLQFSGDNFVIDNGRFTNAHRALIAYGVQRVSGNIWATNTAAAGLSLGSYGSIKDFNINYKDDGTDTLVASAANIAQILAHDTDVAGGASLDLAGGRQHEIGNIKVDFNVSVSARSAACYVGKEGASADGDIHIYGIELSGNFSGTSTGMRIGQGYSTTPTNITNLKFSNIVLKDLNVSASSYMIVSSAFLNSLVVDNYYGGSIYAGYVGSVNEYPIVLKNCAIHHLTLDTAKDVYMHLLDCHVNRTGLSTSAYRIQPFNKVLSNTRIGTSAPITKGRHDIYTHVNDAGLSTPLSNPSDVANYLVGGAYWQSSANVDDTPAVLDLVAEPAATKDDSVTSRQIDHGSFINSADYIPTNTKAFKLSVRDSIVSNVAIYTGFLVVRGAAVTTDFSSSGGTTVALTGVAVHNILGTAYSTSDLTVTNTHGSHTIRFNMAVATEQISVVLYNS